MANYPEVGYQEADMSACGPPHKEGQPTPMQFQAPKFQAPRIDKEMAAAIKVRLNEALIPVAIIVREAVSAEFNVALNFGRDAYGRVTLEAALTKHF